MVGFTTEVVAQEWDCGIATDALRCRSETIVQVGLESDVGDRLQAVHFVGDGEVLVAKSQSHGKRRLHTPLVLCIALIFEVTVIADFCGTGILG